MAPAMRAPESTLSALPDELAEQLFASARTVKLKADQTLFLAGDAGDGCYRVEQGLVKASIVSPSGTERILAVFGAGSVVGEWSMIDEEPRSATVTALKESEMRFVSRAAFYALADRHPDVYRYVMLLLVRRLRATNAVVAAASFLTLKGRVARTLLNLADAFGHDVGSGRILIRQKVNQSDVASMAGIARENASRILNEWKRDGLVSRLAGYYCLEKRASIESEAEL